MNTLYGFTTAPIETGCMVRESACGGYSTGHRYTQIAKPYFHFELPSQIEARGLEPNDIVLIWRLQALPLLLHQSGILGTTRYALKLICF